MQRIAASALRIFARGRSKPFTILYQNLTPLSTCRFTWPLYRGLFAADVGLVSTITSNASVNDAVVGSGCSGLWVFAHTVSWRCFKEAW